MNGPNDVNELDGLNGLTIERSFAATSLWADFHRKKIGEIHMGAKPARESLMEALRDYFQREGTKLGVEVAFLYGSWASGFPRLESDIDIAILFENERASEDLIFEWLNEISLHLTKSLGSEVNVIPIFSDFRKPMLYYNAIVRGIPVFIKDYSRYVQWVNEALHQMEDFGIFGRQWQIALTRNNLEEIKHA
jgi:predicted nucleotidyltransferase